MKPVDLLVAVAIPILLTGTVSAQMSVTFGRDFPACRTQASSGDASVFDPCRAGGGDMEPRVPIINAPVLRAHEITDQVYPEELVLGVVINGEARAYPINMLTGSLREIINDRLGGRAIAATW